MKSELDRYSWVSMEDNYIISSSEVAESKLITSTLARQKLTINNYKERSHGIHI